MIGDLLGGLCKKTLVLIFAGAHEILKSVIQKVSLGHHFLLVTYKLPLVKLFPLELLRQPLSLHHPKILVQRFLIMGNMLLIHRMVLRNLV